MNNYNQNYNRNRQQNQNQGNFYPNNGNYQQNFNNRQNFNSNFINYNGMIPHQQNFNNFMNYNNQKSNFNQNNNNNRRSFPQMIPNQPLITQSFNQANNKNFNKVPDRPKHYRDRKKARQSDPNSPGQSSFLKALQKTPKSRESSTSSDSRDSSVERNRKLADINKEYAEEVSSFWPEAFKKTIDALKTCEEGSEVQAIIDNMQHPRETWNEIKSKVCKDLIERLNLLNVSKCLMFGSAITGLDFLGSDIDFYFLLQQHPATDEDTGRCLNKAAKLVRYKNQFHVFCRILHARIPIIKCIHLETKTMCDINFSSNFGYYNSFFINVVLGLDPRIKELALLIKLWSKTLKINERCRLSSYCVIMMIFYYLQNLEVPILTSIKECQQGLPPIILHQKYRWNFNTSNIIDKSKNNNMTIRELLCGFFEFWTNINYEENVISLYTGSLIKKSEFEQHPEMEYYRELKAKQDLQPMKIVEKCLTIQDGFELHLNIAFKNQSNNEDFFQILKLTNEKLKELKEEKFNDLLVKFLTEIKKPVSMENKKKNQAKKFTINVFPTEADLKITRDYLVKKDSTKIYSSVEIQKFCVENALKNTVKLLQEVYLIDVKTLKEDFSDKLLIGEYDLKLSTDTLSGRKKLNLTNQEKIDAEIKISTEKTTKPENANFDMETVLILRSMNPFKSLEFLFIDRVAKKKSALSTFSTYFSMNIHGALKSYLKQNLESM